ncbi:GGDEF domain-containing protein [Kitasatospora sp. NPDC058201]|uniref:GGDEF domain-containing protein n=1 Tax=unclassified Kitasatospora TaxID=2633591 RepID=UPI00365C936C
MANARAMLLAGPAARIASLREAVRRLLEVNRRLRRRLALSEARERALREEREDLLEELAQARTDPLSGLHGRRAFTHRADELLCGTSAMYGVVLLDLDEFKPVNDRYGHAAGDAVLAAVGARIARWLGPGEAAARLGGDEFVVLAVYDVRLPDRVSALREALTAPVAYGSLSLAVGVSVGVAAVEDPLSRTHAAVGASLAQALSEADSAMYEAKGRGRRGR